MRTSFAIVAIVASLAGSVLAGGPEICTNNKDGSGGTNYQVTKDCCAAVNHKAYFNEVAKQCMGYGGPLDNAVDTGKMVECCSSRGAGSKAV
ncbi:hypothetical protein AAF712_013287 [Marasmius tenuissimus]|uniref:Uncharacterized protein n=1 Tax=Marasmius tenuissimus TaxID=585030 RepID=A0ABR2ZE51_9AGAR